MIFTVRTPFPVIVTALDTKTTPELDRVYLGQDRTTLTSVTSTHTLEPHNEFLDFSNCFILNTSNY